LNKYLYGYNSWQTRLTLPELDQRWAWYRLHPEFRRRLVAMFDAAQAEGTDLGLGGGARSADGQRKLFLQRHEVSNVFPCCTFEGKKYKLRRGMAHAAPPGRSYHEDDAYQGFGVAADLVGDLVWMKRNALRFGFREFSDLKEAWHVQPFEFTDARSKNGNRQLRVWVLPEPPQPPKPPAVNDPRQPRMTLRARVQGPDVFVLQRALNNLMGAKLSVDGVMGTRGETIAAVRMWQQFFKLPVTGVVDQQTWKSIYDIADLRGYKVV